MYYYNFANMDMEEKQNLHEKTPCKRTIANTITPNED